MCDIPGCDRESSPEGEEVEQYKVEFPAGAGGGKDSYLLCGKHAKPLLDLRETLDAQGSRPARRKGLSVVAEDEIPKRRSARK